MTRTSILGACCLAWLAGTTGLPQPADAQALTPITISYQPTNYWALPFYVASKKGWWKEVGLDPKFVLFPAGVPQVAAAAAGSWDVGATGSVPAVIGAARFNIITIGLDNDESATNALIVSGKNYDEFKADPKKMAGQHILLTTNSTVDYAVRSCLAHMKLDAKSVELVNFGQAPIVTALISGKAELGGLWAPNIYSAVEKAGAKVLCSGKDAGVTIPGVLIARGDYAKQNPKLVAAFLAVYVHTWQWAKAHPDEAAKMLQAADVEGGVPLSDFGVKEEFKRPTYSLSEELELMKSSNGASKFATWMNDISAFLVKSGTIPKAPDASSYISDDYMKLVDSDPKLKAFANSSN